MKNKEIQEERMRGYFIEATKQLIKGEGIRSVSVRSVADHAGYSFATMYNYFRNINELVFECVQDFQEECKAYAETMASDKPDCREKLRAKLLAYIAYFTEYPGIFELFFTAKAGELGNKDATMDIIEQSLDNVCQPEWSYCIRSGSLTEERAAHLKTRFRYTITGLLVMYLNRKRPAAYADFMEMVNTQLNEMLDSGI